MRVFICGFGTVGQGFAEVLARRMDFLEERYGCPILVTGAMDSKTYVLDRNGLDPLDLVATKQRTGRVGEDEYTDSTKVLDQAAYDILVEVSPTDIKTGGAGLRNITHALENRKDVITVNKGPLALKFNELITLARRNKCKFRFEGSVGGAMPIINLCRENLRGEKIESIRGIFNGTCNFILSKMDKGQPFDQVLKEAQQMGYAETDPTNDIEGYRGGHRAGRFPQHGHKAHRGGVGDQAGGGPQAGPQGTPAEHIRNPQHGADHFRPRRPHHRLRTRGREDRDRVGHTERPHLHHGREDRVR